MKSSHWPWFAFSKFVARRRRRFTRKANPQVPWSQIARTRDRLIHGYFNVDLDIVWQIASADMPSLVRELKLILQAP